MSKLKKSKRDKIDTSLEDDHHSNRNNNYSNRDYVSNKNSSDYPGKKMNRDYVSNKDSHVGGILARNQQKENNEITVSI